MPDNLLTIPDVMLALHLSRSSVFKLVQSGELRVTYFGRRLLFRPQDVEALVARRAENPRRARKPIGSTGAPG